MLIIAAGRYGGFAAYNLFICGNVPNKPEVVWTAALISGICGGLCFVEGQSGRIGEQWIKHSRCKRLNSAGFIVINREDHARLGMEESQSAPPCHLNQTTEQSGRMT
jgi:hypothetical protein